MSDNDKYPRKPKGNFHVIGVVILVVIVAVIAVEIWRNPPGEGLLQLQLRPIPHDNGNQDSATEHMLHCGISRIDCCPRISDRKMENVSPARSSSIANLVQVVLPITAAISVPPLLLGWALIQAATYLN
jgi:hypothetical protein